MDALNARIDAMEDAIKQLEGALLGTLDGRPGLYAQVERAVAGTEKCNAKLDNLAAQTDSLRLDKAKVAGIIIATSTIVGFASKLLLK